MSSTKIIVVSMKEIIRTTLFAIAGISLIILLIYMFMPKSSSSASVSQEPTTQTSNLYEPGEYTSDILLHNTPVGVTVLVDENSILDVELDELTETQTVFYPILESTAEEVSEKVVETQDTDFDASVNNMYSSKIILDAVDEALLDAMVVQ